MADYFTNKAKVPNIPKGQFSTVMRPFTALQAISNTGGRGLLNNFFNPKGSTAAEVAQSRYGFTKYPPFYNREGDLKPARGTMYPLAWNMGEDFLPYREWGVTPKLVKDALTVVEAGGGRPVTPEQVFEGYMGPAGGALASSLARGAFKGADEGLLGVNVWHGSPHKWKPEPGFSAGRPRLDKVGTGEGATAYGHGFYTAEAKDVGKAYKDNLAGNRGELYKLDIPDADAAKYLDFDAPLSKQPPTVQEALPDLLKKINANRIERFGDDATLISYDDFMKMTGEDLQDNLFVSFGNAVSSHPDAWLPSAKRALQEKAASEALSEAGIPGLKYRDQMSRYDPDILPDNMIANEARKWLGQSNGDSEKAMKLFKDSNPRELYAESEINEIEKVISTASRKITRNYVTWDQDVLDRINLL